MSANPTKMPVNCLRRAMPGCTKSELVNWCSARAVAKPNVLVIADSRDYLSPAWIQKVDSGPE